MIDGRTEDDGSFRLGPLGPGEHNVRVGARLDGSDYGWACDDVLPADPGDEGLEFVMLRTGVLVGRAVDASTGAPTEAEFSVYSEATEGGASYPKPRETVDFKWLPPGTYTLIATTEDGRAGMRRGIEVRGDETTADQVVELKPGGRLRLGPGDTKGYSVRVDGIRINWLSSSGRTEVVVPAGTCCVVPIDNGVPIGDERRITIAAGEVRVLKPE